MGLINYNGWELPKRPYVGRYVNGSNALAGFWKKEYKNGMCDMLLLGNGSPIIKYQYPNIDIPFKHPMVRWENLHFCGGYHLTDDKGTKLWTNEKIVEAVIDGKKPIGFVIVNEDRIDEYVELAKQHNLTYSINDHFWDGKKEFGVAQRGKVGEIFNIQSVAASYAILENFAGYIIFRDSELARLVELEDKELSEFLVGWDYANPESYFDLMKTGLLLGYPIESTFALIY